MRRYAVMAKIVATKKGASTKKSGSEESSPRANLPALTREQAKALADALRRGEATQNRMDSALIEYGSWIVAHVFDGDTRAALAHRRDNAVWSHLLARADGTTLPLNPKFLHVAVRIAAYDQRISTEAWKRLEPSRKELLLPLGDESLLRKAASHVADADLGYDATRAYVAGLRDEKGEAPKARLTGPRVRRLFSEFRGRIAEPAFVMRLGGLRDELTGADRVALRSELRSLRAAIEKLEAKLR